MARHRQRSFWDVAGTPILVITCVVIWVMVILRVREAL
jgi:hypothetical protein